MIALQKLILIALTPSNLLWGLLALAVLLLWAGRRRVGAALATLALIGFALPAWTPLEAWLAAPLEGRFDQPEEVTRVDGIVVLGGSFELARSAARGAVLTNDGAERLTEAAALARRFPAARLIFSGGAAAGGVSEAELARRFFAAQGLAPRLELEDASRDTAENARLSFALADPQPQEAWLLVTSALHMPRALLAFEAAGWRVTPWPVDWLNAPPPDPPEAGWLGPLSRFDRAAAEWLALAAYRLLGRTDRWLPSRPPE